MAWGRKHTAAQKPAWSQDDYHAAFATQNQRADRAGRRAVAEAVSTIEIQRESSNNVPCRL